MKCIEFVMHYLQIRACQNGEEICNKHASRLINPKAWTNVKGLSSFRATTNEIGRPRLLENNINLIFLQLCSYNISIHMTLLLSMEFYYNKKKLIYT